MTATSFDLGALLAVARRRKLPILTTAAVILLLGTTIAFILPAVYRSTATILIEEQEIPQDLVRSAITSYADQRIETIKQQVMSRATLWKIVEQYDLYKTMKKRSPTEDVLQRFVRDTHIDVINAKVVDKRTQNPTQATIAFTLSYDGESPEGAQKVTNELTSLFLAENMKTRERHAQETTAFLKQEADNLADHIAKLEQQIADMKRRADGALPELTPLNMQMLNAAERELTDVDRDIRSLEERKTYLEGELATIKPNTPIISTTGERILDSSERLKALRAEYADRAAYLSAEHPDIMKLEQEVQALEREAGGQGAIDEIVKRLTGEKAILTGLLKRYGAEHPDVSRARRVINSLERELNQQAKQPSRALAMKPENPAYINMHAQFTSAVASLDALKAQRVTLKRRTEEYAKRLEKTHQYEPQYLDLARERDNSSRKYEELRSKLMEAQVSEGLEVQRKGERFSLINPPELPEKPEKPNRPLILFLSFVLAVAGGAGCGALLENLDRSIQGPDSLAAITHAYPLAVIPYIPNNADLRQLIAKRRTVRLAGIGIAAACILLAHFFWLPLDVVWFAALRKFGLD
jgi:uncharacterized protein involved in exopolysaccharide biosynthesis